ncbi:hypothetical protein JZ751_028365 [Albula glossodonta]|uniref:Uncharacterized protein n=1 Tax=Albula glossodonta TaxID=121402 RepID=A0A8T2MNJ0_9TELE|nr:hypothetical protein JZ751_028365 [Albula glossodonta]
MFSLLRGGFGLRSCGTMYRVVAPSTMKPSGPTHFSELAPIGGEPPDTAPPRRSRKVVEYFWLPTDEE